MWLGYSIALVLAALSGPRPVYEAEPAALPFTVDKTLFSPWDLDSGWQPSSGPIQIRILTHAGSGFTVLAPGQARLGWNPERQLWVVGQDNAGSFDMNAGVELEIFLRLRLEIPLGPTYRWEGRVPGAPNFDFRFSATQPFTPFLLEGQSPDFVTVKDAIPPKTLYGLSLEDFIPIPGLGGSLDLRAGGELAATLAGQAVELNPTSRLTSDGSSLPWQVPQAPRWEGQARYDAQVLFDGSLHFEPTVRVGIGPLRWQLASLRIPIPLPSQTVSWSSQQVPFAFKLPRLAVSLEQGAALVLDAEREASVDFESAALGHSNTRTVRLRNIGEAPLSGSVRLEGVGFEAAVSLPPSYQLGVGETLDVPIRLTRPGVGTFEGWAVLESSDPSGTVRLRLGGASTEATEASGVSPDGEASVDLGPGTLRDDAGCGCQSGGDGGLWAAIGFLWLGALRLRRLRRG